MCGREYDRVHGKRRHEAASLHRHCDSKNRLTTARCQDMCTVELGTVELSVHKIIVDSRTAPLVAAAAACQQHKCGCIW